MRVGLHKDSKSVSTLRSSIHNNSHKHGNGKCASGAIVKEGNCPILTSNINYRVIFERQKVKDCGENISTPRINNRRLFPAGSRTSPKLANSCR